MVLNDPGASKLAASGRALVQLRGRELVEIQVPMITRQHLLAAVNGGGPAMPMPESPQLESNVGKAAQILSLAGEGLSRREIERQVFGYTGGSAHRQVSEVLESATTTAPQPNFAPVAGSGSIVAADITAVKSS